MCGHLPLPAKRFLVFCDGRASGFDAFPIDAWRRLEQCALGFVASCTREVFAWWWVVIAEDAVNAAMGTASVYARSGMV